MKTSHRVFVVLVGIIVLLVSYFYVRDAQGAGMKVQSCLQDFLAWYRVQPWA